MVDQKNKEVEAQQKINGLAKQANKYVTQMSEKPMHCATVQASAVGKRSA
ncbi:hypothetical protein ACVXG7_02845 [Enterobacter hormaechei]